MVELAVIQSVSSIASTYDVLLGVIYYVNNLRETNKNRRITLTNSLMQSFVSREGLRLLEEIWLMEWSDFDDFVRKYDSTVKS